MEKSTADIISDTEVLQAPQPETAQKQSDKVSEQKQAPITVSTEKSSYNTMKVVERDSRIFLLSNDKRKGNVIIDLEEDVIDPDTVTPQNPKGKVRRMRLLRGAQSIWRDEQPPLQFDKEYVAKNVLTVIFSGGKLIVPIHEVLKLKALTITNRNDANPYRFGAKDIYFHEWNPVAENEKTIKEENLVVEAMGIAFSAPFEQMIPHIHYLNIQIHDIHGVPLDESALRAAYIRVAKNEPAKFLQSIKSPNVQTGYLVRLAIESKRIDLGSQPGMAYWSDGGFISSIPDGKDPVDYLIEFANFHGEDSKAFVSQLKAK